MIREPINMQPKGEQNGCRPRMASVVSATSCTRRRLIRDVGFKMFPFEEAAISRYIVTMNTAEIQKMSPPERLRTMEALWEALCHESEEPKSPEWHAEVLAGRKRRIESGEAKFVSIEEARKRLQK